MKQIESVVVGKGNFNTKFFNKAAVANGKRKISEFVGVNMWFLRGVG